MNQSPEPTDPPEPQRRFPLLAVAIIAAIALVVVMMAVVIAVSRPTRHESSEPATVTVPPSPTRTFASPTASPSQVSWKPMEPPKPPINGGGTADNETPTAQPDEPEPTDEPTDFVLGDDGLWHDPEGYRYGDDGYFDPDGNWHEYAEE